MKATYKLVPPTEEAMTWEGYSEAVRQELRELLAARECREKVFQRLIERHPSLLPWSYGTFGGGHHGLAHGSLVSQPRLAGLGGCQPDFLYISLYSASIYAVLIEIESPCKQWFTKSGQPRSELTQSINQLREWKRWFERPGNEARFRDEYAVPAGGAYARRRFLQKYYLVYGRRDDLLESGSPDQRSRHEGPDEHFISWDHLAPAQEHRDTITAVVDERGYKAISVPPTLRLGPVTAREHFLVEGKTQAADVHPMMTRGRASFLRERWQYWDAWASNDGSSLIEGNAWE